jgi:hypothetical protein
MKKRVSKNIVKKSKSISPNKIGLATFIIVTFLTIISLLYIGLIVKPQQYASPTFTNQHPLFDPAMDTSSGQKIKLSWKAPLSGPEVVAYKIYYGNPYSKVLEASKDFSKRSTLQSVTVKEPPTSIVLQAIPTRAINFNPEDLTYGIFVVAVGAYGLESDSSNLLKYTILPVNIISPYLIWMPSKTYPYKEEQRFIYSFYFPEGQSLTRFRVYETFGDIKSDGSYIWTEVRDRRREAYEEFTYTNTIGEGEVKEYKNILITESVPYKSDKKMHLVKVETTRALAFSFPSTNPNSGYGSGYGYGYV